MEEIYMKGSMKKVALSVLALTLLFGFSALAKSKGARHNMRPCKQIQCKGKKDKTCWQKKAKCIDTHFEKKIVQLEKEGIHPKKKQKMIQRLEGKIKAVEGQRGDQAKGRLERMKNRLIRIKGIKEKTPKKS